MWISRALYFISMSSSLLCLYLSHSVSVSVYEKNVTTSWKEILTPDFGESIVLRRTPV